MNAIQEDCFYVIRERTGDFKGMTSNGSFTKGRAADMMAAGRGLFWAA
jgi:hypothetical protein